MSRISSSKLKSLFWLISFFVILNLLLVIVIFSLYIERNNITKIVALAGVYISQDEIKKRIKVGKDENLKSANKNLEEFAESEVESLETRLSEEEINVLVQDLIEHARKEEKADEPSEQILEESRLEGWTDTLSWEFINIESLSVFVDVLNGNLDLYISLDGGLNWFVFTLEPVENKGRYATFRIVDLHSKYPRFLNNLIIENLNKGIEDAIIDFNEKTIGGRQIVSVRLEEEEILLIGNIKKPD